MEKFFTIALLFHTILLPTVAFQSTTSTTIYNKLSSNLKQQQQQQQTHVCNNRRQKVILSLKSDWFAPDSHNDDDDEEDILVTREMLQRDLLGQDPLVKRKRKGGKQNDGSYKPLDNRDQLPFNVTVLTPEPYTHPEIKKAKAKKQKPAVKKTDLDHQLTPAKIYQTNESNGKTKKQKGGGGKNGSDKNNDTTYLGDFKLDKSTTSGDVIVIGDREFEVQKARCLYRYAGGQRFVMARKILEVKEVSRVQKEEFLMKQYQRSPDSRHDTPPNLE